jgi:ADP-heptose:LPS heptosyltransferase
MLKRIPANVIISRTDSIGDMILALPLAKVLKHKYPKIKVAMLGKKHTEPVALASKYVDAFIDVDDFLNKNILINNKKPEAIVFLNTDPKPADRAYALKIPVRIGTGRNLNHLKNCNYRVWFTRRNSGLHEGQLNLKMLSPFDVNKVFTLEEIGQSYGLTQLLPLQGKYKSFIKNDKYNLIIHTKSQGNAREWSMDHFIRLIQLLNDKTYNIFISGTERERAAIQPLLNAVKDKVTDIIGIMPLEQFMSFINLCDGLIANSTGPLHVAAALQKDALGIFPPIKSKDAVRWGPVGPRGKVFTLPDFCEKCKLNKDFCACINSIQPQAIKAVLDKLAQEKLHAAYST